MSANAAYHAAELDGRSFFELGARAFDVPALHVAVDECLASSKAFRDVELDLPALAGGRSYSIAGLPIPPGSGPSTMLLAIADVSRQRVHESERARLLASEREARLEAQRANHAKDMFLATLSHELRTPLNTILLGAQLLRKQASSPETERASSAIERAALSQARLIEDLLDVSRIVSGKLSLELQVVELAPVVRTAVDLARGAAEAKGVVLTIEEGPEVGSVLGDPSRLQQVVANLLTNVIKFTAKGGHVEVRVEKREDHGHVTVRDDGIGIEAEVIPQLFERFVQADSSVTRSQGGLGLGLAIVRHLVAVHGGEVRARSEGLGRGSTFEVIVPLVPPGTMPPPRSEASGQATSGSLEGLRVVVIDDDDDTREGLAAMLRQMGVDVRAASSAAEGLEVVGEVRPHAVLCDVAMPGEDGYAFVRKLRARPAEDGGRTPAAALTALASPADRAEALAAGFQMHVAKPIDTGRLASVILSLASRR